MHYVSLWSLLPNMENSTKLKCNLPGEHKKSVSIKKKKKKKIIQH